MTTTPTTPTNPATPAAPGAQRHLSGLEDAALVQTGAFKKAQIILGQAVALGDIAAIAGPPGCGKTFSVDHFVHHSPHMVDRRWHWLDMPPKPTTKEVTQRLMRGLGVPFARTDTEYQLTEDLVPELAGSGRVVVIDEAQNLKADGLQQLRYLHDRCRWTWTLILVGSTVDRALSSAAELSSRVSGWVTFEPLEGATMLTAVREWHPLLISMDPALLLRVDEVYARGNWRRWGQFLRVLLAILDRQPTGTLPDARLVSAALEAVKKER